MATNDLKTITMITREMSRLLHQKLNFIGACNKQYDDRFAQTGAKIGTSLNIRQPSRFVTRDNATFSAQDYVERSTPLTVSSQVGIDVSFTSVEMTMSLDDLGPRILEPAAAQLAATLESRALSAAYKLTADYVGTTNAAMTFKEVQQMRQYLTEKLAPPDNRTLCAYPTDVTEFADAAKTWQHPEQNLNAHFREGMLGRTGGLDVYENTLLPSHTNGTIAGSPLTTGTNGNTTTTNSWVSQTTLSIVGATSLTTLLAGDIITLSLVYDVHPESKTALARLKRFVVQEAVTMTTAATNYAVVVKPPLIWGIGNAYRTAFVSGASSSGLTVTLALAAGTSYYQSLAFHKDAFVFATADLIDVSQYGARGARVVQDGISMRTVQQYDVASDTVPLRFDVLWGFGGLNIEHAVRAMHA